jgi:hypothetical protein
VKRRNLRVLGDNKKYMKFINLQRVDSPCAGNSLLLLLPCLGATAEVEFAAASQKYNK